MNFSRSLTLLTTTTFLFAGVTNAVHAQTVDEGTFDIEDDLFTSSRPPPSVAPLTARFRLNGETFDYGAKGTVSLGATGGSNINSNPLFTGTLTLKSELIEGIVAGNYERNQSGWYLQHDRIDRRRDVDVIQQQAVDLIGYRLQFSATGNCISADTTEDQLCTFTPGLATVPGAYDPSFLLPTELKETSQAGDVISQETYDAIQGDGFIRGQPGTADPLGIDLDIPNSGSISDSARAGLNGVERRERVSMRSVVSLSRVEQNIYSNDRQASVDRTIRGFVLVRDDEWTERAALMQAAAWLLPQSSARLSLGEEAPELNIANNLFYAANNQWTPPNSFAVYQTGRGYVTHATQTPRDITETPVGFYNGFWMGYSPVRKTELTNTAWVQPTGLRETTSGPSFFQGGTGEFAFPESSITIIDDLTNQISQIELSAINNLFVQSGLELTEQDALAYSQTRETSIYSLVPHVAFSGNRTDGTSVLRYYTGAVLGDNHNAYLGGDYALTTQGGISVNAGAMAYSNPDRDYFSFAQLRIVKNDQLENGGSISYGVGARQAFNRPEASLDRFDSISRDSVFDLLARYEAPNDVSYDIRQRRSEDADGESHSTTLGLTYQASDRFSFNAQVTPFSTEHSYIRSRLGMSWRVSDAEDAAAFQMQVLDAKYDFGTDSEGQSLETSEQTILALLQKKF